MTEPFRTLNVPTMTIPEALGHLRDLHLQTIDIMEAHDPLRCVTCRAIYRLTQAAGSYVPPKSKILDSATTEGDG